MQQVLTLNEIIAAYPNQWVLVGNPVLDVATLKAGVVIATAKDKRDLVESGKDWRADFKSAMTYFTGPRPQNRRFLL